ncbi:hypothetical protein DASC09_036370 [Saccharomycopsis crataegensis]|uniref:PUM-HD domain-containing protein n=1 Tax=Saccharomycopsis crataegensis TaxID=43959 RepID=A0AAV5QNC8_9ASCO|nr:hypothetical protein DASC09_036370 [Saccharomycopsis crataegensis]
MFETSDRFFNTPINTILGKEIPSKKEIIMNDSTCPKKSNSWIRFLDSVLGEESSPIMLSKSNPNNCTAREFPSDSGGFNRIHDHLFNYTQNLPAWSSNIPMNHVLEYATPNGFLSSSPGCSIYCGQHHLNYMLQTGNLAARGQPYQAFSPEIPILAEKNESYLNEVSLTRRFIPECSSAVSRNKKRPGALQYSESYFNIQSPPMSTQSMEFHNQSQQLNYRTLLDKDIDYDWNLIIARITDNNEQQASIFLQQKLKQSNPEIRKKIYEAIFKKSFLLSINKFGNFLVQRALEYGTVEQNSEITSKIIGNVIQLSTDPYGCHVIQKALDYTNEFIKDKIVEEISLDIGNTFSHRHACHVWQKIIEISWDRNSSNMIDVVLLFNKEFKGKWGEVCTTPSGSLVVQSILETFGDSQKKSECVDEIIQNLNAICCNQWGNWVIKHLLEFCDEGHKATVINKIIGNAINFSFDQYGATVIETMFKVSDESVIQRYLDAVCIKVEGKARVALVDISSNIYGSFIIQFILKKGLPGHKQEIIQYLKRHMVFLRSSKWGSQCVWLINQTENS